MPKVRPETFVLFFKSKMCFMVQKTSATPSFSAREPARESGEKTPARRKGGRPPKKEGDLLDQLIRTNVTRRELEHLLTECQRVNLTRRLSFAGFVRERLIAGTAAPTTTAREELLLETLQRLQDCRLALQASRGGENGADQPALAATLQRLESLIDQLASWWFD